MKTIGPQFGSELRAAGLFGLPFSWQADGVINFGEAMTTDQIAAVNAVHEAHDETKQLTLTPLQNIRAAEEAAENYMRKASRIATLDSALDKAMLDPRAAGKTREEVRAMYRVLSKTFKTIDDLEIYCEAERKKIV